MKQVEIKPEQLRKGNLMTNNADGSLIVVKAYDIYCLQEGMDSFIMQPLPLTEDWLINFGFVKRGRWLSNSLLECCIDEDGFHVRIIIGGVSKYLRHYDYVHQLQNLYFALTEEELTLK